MAVFLFLGFPSLWDKIFAVITGVAIIAVAYGMNTENNLERENEHTRAFVDNVSDTRN